MQLDVDIAGHLEPWRLRDSRAVEEWLGSKPWLEVGGCRALALGEAVRLDGAVTSLRRLVRGIDNGDVGARVELLEVETADTLLADLCRFFELSVGGDSRDVLHRLGHALGYERCCLILTTASDQTLLFDEAAALSEAIYKVSTEPAAFFVVHRTKALGDSDHFDLSFGQPLEGMLHRAVSEAARWRAYLHLLVGWESGGRPVTASEWGEGCASLAFGDESGLLRALDERATTTYRQIPTSLRRAVDRGLDPWSAAWSEARRVGLLWCVSGETRESLSPWVRRAVRSRQAKGTRRSLLPCDWLNRELLSGCFAVERLLRRHYASTLGRITPSFDVAKRVGNPASKRMLRPDADEAVADPWNVASFGEMMAAIGDAMPCDERHHLENVRAIRNAAAHGQPLGWAAVCGLANAYAEVRWFPSW